MKLFSLLGKRVKVLRERKGLTQEELEEKTGINTKYISAIERGNKNATIKTLEKIAEGLDVELYELFLFTVEPGSERAMRKVIESLLKDSDLKTLKLCLEFLRKAAD